MKMETLHNLPVQMCVGSEDLGPAVTFINSAIPIGLLCDWNAAFTLGKVQSVVSLQTKQIFLNEVITCPVWFPGPAGQAMCQRQLPGVTTELSAYQMAVAATLFINNTSCLKVSFLDAYRGISLDPGERGGRRDQRPATSRGEVETSCQVVNRKTESSLAVIYWADVTKKSAQRTVFSGKPTLAAWS